MMKRVENTVQEAGPRCNKTVTGRNKNIGVDDKHNTALKIQIHATNYMEQSDLVCLGDESGSGAVCLTPCGAL